MSTNYFINLHSVVPMRGEPRESSEMVSQLLFGEFGQVLEIRDNFTQIKNHFDGYWGWVDTKTILLIDSPQHATLASQPIYRTRLPVTEARERRTNSILRLSPGSILPELDVLTGSFGFGLDFQYETNTAFVKKGVVSNASDIAPLALLFLNTPYLWGGKNIFGIDCSGFSQVVFSILGWILPRDASQQVAEGTSVDSLTLAKAGDLAFFEKNGKITHVGILLSASEIIHASGKVKIEKLDETGIISTSSGNYTHHLAAIRRIIG